MRSTHRRVHASKAADQVRDVEPLYVDVAAGLGALRPAAGPAATSAAAVALLAAALAAASGAALVLATRRLP